MRSSLVSSKKTAIHSIIALVVSFSVFFLIMFSLPDPDFQIHKEFYSDDLGVGKKVFLLGSSHIFALNTTTISEQLVQHGHNYDVYNLGQGSDDPESRLRTIDMIISKKPEVVAYGIDFRDFESAGRSIEEKPPNALPDPIDMYKDAFPFDHSILENPKFAIIRTLNIFFRIDSTTTQNSDFKIPYPNTPFFKYSLEDTAISLQTELEKKDVKIGEIYPPQKNLSLYALKQIIHRLQENDVKVIIFTTPHSKFWLEQQSTSQKQVFDLILKDLETEFNFKIYKLHDKYDDMNIWKDNTHLAINLKTSFYSTDIVEIILSEINT